MHGSDKSLNSVPPCMHDIIDSFTISMSKRFFWGGLQLFCSGVTVEASFFGLVVGAVELFCSSSSGVGLFCGSEL